MDLRYTQLWLGYAVLLVLSVCLTRNRFSPAIAFFATWSFSLGLLSLGSMHSDFRPPDLPREAWIYLMLAGCCFFGGTVFAHAVGPARRRALPSGDNPASRESFNFPALKVLALLAFALTTLHMYREAPNLRNYLTSGREIREQLTDASAGGASGLAALATYAALLVIPVAAIYWLRHRRLRWWMIIPVLSLGLLALLSIGKFLFIFLGLTFLNMALYLRPARAASRFRYGPIFAVVAVIFGSFFVITEIRNRSDSSEERGGRSGLLFTLYDYATGYVPAFGGFYEEYLAGAVSTRPVVPDYVPDNSRPGNQTFSGIYRSLAQAGLVKQSASNRYEGSFNVYTLHRDLIMDFGSIGGLVTLFLMGFGLTLFYRLSNRSDAGTVILLGLLTTQVEFTLIYSLFGFIFYPLLLAISPALARLSPPAASPRRTLRREGLSSA